MRQAADAALQLEMHLKNAFNVQTGKLDLAAFNRSLQQGNMTLQQYSARLSALGVEGQQAFLKVAQAVASAELPIRRSSAALDRLWITMKNTARWQLTSSMLHGFIGAVQTAYGYTQDLNESLNSIRIVTSKSVEDMERFAKTANEAARNLSTTTTRYTDASLIYYQQGLSDEEVAGRTEVTIKLANAAGEAAETASEQLTAVWNNFYDGSQSLEHYADVLTALGATTASSTAEISAGLQKFAAVADTVGLSYEYAAAALATVTATTRESADTVGTAFRTLFGRLESLKLGETLDDGTTLNKYAEGLLKVGVNIKDASGELKDMDQILDESMEKWSTLSRDQQVALAQTVAGVRQYAQFIALMDNADFFRENLATARNSEGTLQKQADIYAESWEAARDRMRAAAEEIYSDIIDDQSFIKLTDNLTGVLNRVDDIVKSVGGLGGILRTVFTVILSTYTDKFNAGLRDVAYNFSFIGDKAKQAQIELKQSMAQMIQEMNTSDDIAGRALGLQADATKRIVDLQIEIDQRAKNFTDLQAQQVQNSMALIFNEQQRLNVLAEQARQLETETKAVEDLMIVGDMGFNTDKFKELFSGSQWGAIENELKELGFTFTDLADGKAAPALDSIITRVKELASTIIPDWNSKLQDSKDKLAQIPEAERATSQEAQKLTQEITRQEAEVAKNQKGFAALLRMLRAYNNENVESVKEFEKLTSKIIEVTKSADTASRSINELSKKIEDFIYGFGKNMTDWANIITGVGQGLMGLRMGISGIQSLGRIFSDEDMTAAERLTTLLSGLVTITYAINPLTKAYGALRMAIAGAGAARVAENAAIKVSAMEASKDAIAKSLNAGAEKNVAEAAGRTAAAKTLENAAFAQGLAILAPYLLALTGLTVVIYGVVKAYNADADAAKAVAKAHEAATKAAEEAKQAYEGLKSAVDKYHEASTAIQDLDKHTQEYRDAVESANEKARELLNTYKELRKYARYENGILTIGETGISNTIDSYRNRASASEKASYIAEGQSAIAAQRTAFTEARRRADAGLTDEAFQSFINAYVESGKQVNILTDYFRGNADKVAAIIDDYLTTCEESTSTLKYANNELVRSALAGNKAFEKLDSTSQDVVSKLIADRYSDTAVAEYAESRYDYYSRLLPDNIFGATRWASAGNGIQQMLDDYAESQGYQAGSAKWSFKGYSFVDRDGITRTETVSREQIARTLAQYETLNKEEEESIAALDERLNAYTKLIDTVGNVNGHDFTDIINNLITTGSTDVSALSPTMADALRRGLDAENGEIAEALANVGEGYLDEITAAIDSYDIEPWANALEAKFAAAGERGEQARKMAFTALQTIGDGGLLDNTAIENLKAAFEGIADLTNFEKLSVDEQIKTLTALTKNVDDSVSAYEKYIKALKKELSGADGQLEIELQFKIDKAERELEKLKKRVEKDPWNIELFDERAIAAEVGNVRKAFALIDKERRVSSENLVELTKRYPEALQGASYEAATNTLRITEDMYNKIRGYAESELDKKRDDAAEELLERAKTETRILEVMSIAEQAKRDEDVTTLRKAIENGEIKEEDAKAAAHRIVVATLREEISKRKADNETQLNNTAGIKATEETTTNSLKAMSENSRVAAENFQNYFEQALSNTSQSMVELANNPFAFAANHTKRGINASATKWAEEGQVASVTSAQEKIKQSDEYKQREKEIRRLELIQNYADKLEEGTLSEVEKRTAIRQIDALGLDESTSKTLWSYFNGKTVAALYNGVDASGGQIAQSNTTNALEEISKILADLIAGKEENNRDTSSAQKLQKETLEKAEEQEERYHRINRLIAEQEKLLDKLDTKAQRTYGTQRLQAFEEELKAINKQADYYQEKLDEANEKWLPKDVDKVLERFSDATIENGFVKDTASLLDKSIDEYNVAINGYNDFLKTWNNYTAGQQAANKQQKQDQDEILKQAKQKYELDKAAIEQYEETIDLIRELEENRAEQLRAARDKELESLNYKLQVQLDIRDLKRQINDFSRTIAESYGDALTHTSRVFDLNTADANAELGMLDEYFKKYQEYKILMDNADEFTNIDEIRSSMEDLTSKIIESGENLLDWIDYWENMIPDAVNAAADRFQQFTDQLQHNTTVLDTIKELYALQGQSYRTQAGFNRLQRVSQERMDAAVATSQLQRKWYDRARQELAEAQAALDRANDGDYNYDFLKSQRDAYLEEFNKAQEAYLSAAQEALETAKDMFVEQIERASYEFGQKMVEGIETTNLDTLQEQYDHFISVEEEYFDDVNRAYQQATWFNRINADIANSTNKAYQERLAAFRDQLVAQRTSTDLDQYDLDIIEARYKLLQAEAALEDAQNSKTNLQLVRDSQGNWNYRYTADSNAIAEASKNVLDAQNEWYNIAKERTKDVTGDIIANWKACQDAIAALAEQQWENEEDYQRAVDEIQSYYTERNRYLMNERAQAMADMTEAGSESITGFSNTYAEQLAAMTTNNNDFDAALTGTLTNCKTNYNDFHDTVKDVADKTGVELDELDDDIKDVGESTDDLARKGEECATRLWNQISKIDDVADSYDNLAKKISNAITQMETLARKQSSDIVSSYNNSETHSTSTASEKKYDASKDYSAAMRDYVEGYIENTKNGTATEAFSSYYYRTLEAERAAKIKGEGLEGEVKSNQELREELRKLFKVGSFDTGGYTGTFSDAKLAFLHEKELVLNQEDTANILAATAAVRDITRMIDGNTQAALGAMVMRLGSVIAPAANPTSSTIDQNVNIEANFPGVQSAIEIEQALRNLVANADQYAGERD